MRATLLLRTQISQVMIYLLGQQRKDIGQGEYESKYEEKLLAWISISGTGMMIN